MSARLAGPSSATPMTLYDECWAGQPTPAATGSFGTFPQINTELEMEILKEWISSEFDPLCALTAADTRLERTNRNKLRRNALTD